MLMMEKQEDINYQGNPSPFAVPINTQLFGYYQWCEAQRRIKKSRLKKVAKKVNKVCPVIEKERAIVVTLPTAITDIDAGYFTDLTGRPVREKFSRNKYVEQIRKVLRAKLLIGFYRDDCLRIDQQFSEEKKRLAAIERLYRHYNCAFEDYLSNDHEISMKILDKANNEIEKSKNLVAKRDELSNKFGQVRLEVYQWEELWRIAKMCHEFFRKITSTLPQLTTTHESVSFKKKKKSSQRTSILGTLESLVEAFEKDVNDDCLGSIEMCLKDPHELSQIFATIEQRNLDALIHLESLASPIAEMSANILRAEELIGSEIELIEESLAELKTLINVNEERASELESYANHLLHQVFRELVCSDSVLHLRVFIEDTYESCIGSNDASLDNYSMMRIIEKSYENLNMSLDSLPHEIVKICEKEGFAQEIKTMKEAEDAARKFDLMHRLLTALERIMESPYDDPKSKLEHISKISSNKTKLVLSSPNILGVMKTKNYPNLHITLKKSRLFFNENCHPSNFNISNEFKIETRKIMVSKVSPESLSPNDNTEDCRDEILQTM